MRIQKKPAISLIVRHSSANVECRQEIMDNYIFQHSSQLGPRFGWRCRNSGNRVGRKGSYETADAACSAMLLAAVTDDVSWQEYAFKKVCTVACLNHTNTTSRTDTNLRGT